MEKYKKVVGDFGEQLIKKYLAAKGYEILGAKIKIGYQEIDIVARQNNKIIFVEVKTRTSGMLGAPEEAMGNQKIKNLKKAMEAYALVHNHDFDELRGDLIAVIIDKQKKIANIKHYKDVF